MEKENIKTIRSYFLKLQNDICKCIERIDLHKFREDRWSYDKGLGGGITRVLENGDVIDKAGVNFSHVIGDSLPQSLLLIKPELKGYKFEAMGVSTVIHPVNPFVPVAHSNLRFFIASKNKEIVWWFGGGFDLTPFYGFVEDCIYWHRQAYNACKNFGLNVYEDYKHQCDCYFYLPHRNEHRGIGGIFFDYLNKWKFRKCENFIYSVGSHFIEAYFPIISKRKNIPYSQDNIDFQMYRRGRYVEFNLILDKGTHFGLQSRGRTESILISLPPIARWIYDYKPKINSEEEKLIKYFLIPRNWLKYS